MFPNLQLILILRVKDKVKAQSYSSTFTTKNVQSGVCDMLQAPQVQLKSRYLSRVFIAFEFSKKRITLVFVS